MRTLFRKPFSPALFWDELMVYTAMLNLALIGFDWTYLWARPFYLRHLPPLVELYDPVKGISPRPATEGYLGRIDELEGLLDKSGGLVDREVARSLQGLRAETATWFEDDPFEDTGKATFEALKVRVLAWAEVPEPASRRAEIEAFQRLWAATPGALEGALAFFDREVRPLLEANYARARSARTGAFADHFWWLDLPFLCLFLLEFLIRWGLAVRRRTFGSWYTFPLVNWYDLLGLVPYFRIFRLFRVASIYIRLHKSELTKVGQGAISRAGRRLTHAVAEEVTDLVAVRILAQIQDEIREGTHRAIVVETLAPRREEIRDRLVAEIHGLVASPDLQERARHFVRINLDSAFEHATALQHLPFSDTLLRPLVVTVGDAVLGAMLQTLAANLESEEGRRALEETGDALVDALFANLDERELVILVEEVVLDVLERTKGAVSVRRWDESGRARDSKSPRANGLGKTSRNT